LNIQLLSFIVKRKYNFFYLFSNLYIADTNFIGYISQGVSMGMTEKIRILLVKRGNISEAELARRLGMSTQNLYNRLKRDNFTDKDLQKIAVVLDCTFEAGFQLNDTGEKI
jgi:DNA-binding Xre family transcriptional regulator